MSQIHRIKGIEETPLGRARKVIDAAHEEIGAALAAWAEEPGSRFSGPESFELEPDSETLGFALNFDYFDRAPEKIGPIIDRLAPLLRRLGVGSVNAVGQVIDGCFVPEEEKEKTT